MLAVVPAFFAPLQSMLSFLPQIAIAVAAAATAVFRPQAYRWAWQKARSHRLVSALVVAVVIGGSAWAIGWGRHQGPPPPPPTTEEKRDGWWTFRHDTLRTGGDGSAIPGPVTILWKFRESLDRAPFASSPAVWAGRVYVGCDNDALYCFDAAQGGGDPLWVFPARYPVFASPVVANGKVYFGEGLHHNVDAKLYCADAATGHKLWEFKTTSHVEDAPTVANGRCWFGAGDDGLYCLDAETGAKIWQSKGMHLDCSPLLTGGLVVVGAGYGETGVAAYSATDGAQKWFTKLPASSWGPPSLGPRGAIVGIGNGNFVDVVDDPKAELVCLALDGGGIVWRLPLKNAVLASALVVGDRVFIGDRSGDFSCVDANSGKLIWQVACDDAVLSSAALAGDTVVFGCQGGHVHALKMADGAPAWKYDGTKDSFNRGGFLSSPAVVGGKVYVGSDNFCFYCLGKK